MQSALGSQTFLEHGLIACEKRSKVNELLPTVLKLKMRTVQSTSMPNKALVD